MARLWLFFIFAVLVIAGPHHAFAQTPTTVEFATLSPSVTQVPGKFCYSNGQDLVCDGTIPPNAGLGVSDSIVSGTNVITVNQSSGNVSLTTAGIDWGYLQSNGFSYLPYLNSSGVSSTGIISSTNSYVYSSSNAPVIIQSSQNADNSTYQSVISNRDANNRTTWFVGDGSSAKRISLSAQMAGYDLTFNTSATFRMNISSAGNVAIGMGATNASTTLQVSGTGTFTSMIAEATQQCASTADVGKMYRHPNGKWATCALR